MFEEDKVRQLTEYMKDSFGMDPETVKSGIAAGNAAMEEFHRKLKAAGKKVLEQVRKEGRYAVFWLQDLIKMTVLLTMDCQSC